MMMNRNQNNTQNNNPNDTLNDNQKDIRDYNSNPISNQEQMANVALMTKREEDVMNILWHSDKPLMAKEIVQRDKRLPINTVQALLRKMLKNKWIKVNDIVYSHTVLARNYIPAMTAEQYATWKLMYEYRRFGNSISLVAFMDKLLESDDKEQKRKDIEDMEKMLDNFSRKHRLSQSEKTPTSISGESDNLSQWELGLRLR